MTVLSCSLCSNNVPSYPILEDNNAFCCHGCHTVYKILLAKNSLSNFHEHPVFQQALRAGIISNQALLDQMRENSAAYSDEEFQKLHLEINEMWCPSCAEVIKLVLMKQKGVKHCIIDYTTDLASIEFAPQFISKDQIYGLIKSLGYHPQKLENAEKKAVSYSLYLRFIIAAFCSLNVMMFSYPIYASYFDADDLNYAKLFSWLSLVASLPILTYCAYPIYKRFYNSIKNGILGMESLIMIGVFSAFSLSLFELLSGTNYVYSDTLTVIITFVLLGKIIESKAKFCD